MSFESGVDLYLHQASSDLSMNLTLMVNNNHKLLHSCELRLQNTSPEYQHDLRGNLAILEEFKYSELSKNAKRAKSKIKVDISSKMILNELRL